MISGEESPFLGQSGLNIAGVGVGHGLDGHWCTAADDYIPHLDWLGSAAGIGILYLFWHLGYYRK